MILTDIIRTGGQTSWVPVVTDTPRVASVTNDLIKVLPHRHRCAIRCVYKQVFLDLENSERIDNHQIDININMIQTDYLE